MHAWTMQRKCELSPRVALMIIIASTVFIVASILGTLAYLNGCI